MAPLKDKQRFFAELEALQKDPDDEYEEDTSDARAVFEHSRPLKALSSAPIRSSAQNLRTPSLLKKLPASLNRTESAPTPASSGSIVKETPPIPRIAALRRSSTATTPQALERPLPSDTSIIKETPLAEMARRPVTERRTVSNPVLNTPGFGTPFSSNSSGFATLLGKRKRKEIPFKLRPEEQQYFKGLKFYYIPPDDTAPARRLRINKSREHGVVWSKELVPDVTHIVADKILTYKDVMAFLKLDKLPSTAVLVNEDYPIDCYGSFKCLLNPHQTKYMVKGYEKAMEPAAEQSLSTTEFQKPDASLQVKPAQTRPGKWDYVPPNETPPRSEHSSQRRRMNISLDLIDESPGFRLAFQDSNNSQLVESPQEHSMSCLKHGSLSRQKDELDEVIETALELKHLPLDDDDDEDRPSSRDSTESDDYSTDNEPSPPRKADKPTRKKTYGGSGFNQENFSCMTGGTGKIAETNPNSRTIEVLQEMCDHYTRIKDQWRPQSYQKAIGVLKKQTTKITTAKEAIKLTSVGKQIAAKIEEIVKTDRLRRLESAKDEPTDKIFQLFLNIYQVGPTQASKWVARGYKTLEDVKAKETLSPNQQFGIEHYDDLLMRIPRDEVTALAEIVSNTARDIDPQVKVVVGGSYRRGAETSGDVDILLTRPETTSSKDLLSFLHKLVSALIASGFLVAALATPKHSGSKWHGCCVLPSSLNPVWRRVDFLLVPENEFGAALIYWTGDDIFNRSMRLLSRKKGMRLNQRGLYKNVMRGPSREKITEGTLVAGDDEMKVFRALNVPWRPPYERICH